MSDDDKKKPELAMLGNLSEMTEEELVESIMQFVESKIDAKKGNE